LKFEKERVVEPFETTGTIALRNAQQ